MSADPEVDYEKRSMIDDHIKLVLQCNDGERHLFHCNQELQQGLKRRYLDEDDYDAFDKLPGPFNPLFKISNYHALTKSFGLPEGCKEYREHMASDEMKEEVSNILALNNVNLRAPE